MASHKDLHDNFFFWIIVSTAAHIGSILSVALVLVVLQFFLGWEIPLFSMQMKPRDVEFVLVDNSPPQQPRKPTNKRAERSSRSGGQKIPNRPEQMPQRAAGAPAPKATPRPTVQPQPQPRPAQQRQQVARTQQAPMRAPQSKPAPKPSPPSPKVPTPTKVASANPSLPPNPIAPTIKTPAPKNPSASAVSGPVVKTPGSGTSGGSTSGASGSPGPSMIAGSPSRAASAGSQGGSGGSGGTGQFNQGGSPGGGGGRDGIDAMGEPDFGPYIAELQRRIKRNWSPPMEDKSKRVITHFKISRDGRLIGYTIQRSSGSPAADAAAVAAIKLSAPFRPLPPNYRGQDIDVQFTFDYETFGQGGNIRMR